jgi:hypothetical protein
MTNRLWLAAYLRLGGGANEQPLKGLHEIPEAVHRLEDES